jgi:AAA15 family ATPase/GTPase
MISRITFENFRGFQCLDLQNLNRVNLVVGKNNAGKTSLLEGITLVYAPEKIIDMPKLFRMQAGSDEKRYFTWLKNKNGKDTKISIDNPKLLLDIKSKNGKTYFESEKHKISLGERENRIELFQLESIRKEPTPSSAGGFILTIDIKNKSNYALNKFQLKQTKDLLKRTDLLLSLLSTEHYSPEHIVGQFGKAIRQKNGEEQIEAILKKVDPRIRKIRVDPAEDGNQIVVDIGLDEMIPLTQAGQGIYRLVTILSELIGEKPKVCLIDEIENGIHHTSLKTLWAGIAEIAEQLDIQVFATTHSHECIEAAHEVYSERENYDFSIVQLFRLESEIQGRVLGKEDIEIAVDSDIELR